MKSSNRIKKRNKYINPYQQKDHRNFFSWLGFCMGLYNDKHPRPEIPHNFEYPQKNEVAKTHLPQVSWINHSTFLIEVDGLRFLTDPIWSDRCSPVQFLGPKRQHAPGIGFEDLPKVDYVLLSHNHFDHLDRQTVRKLHQKFPHITWIIPDGMKKWFKRHKITNVVEFDWWDRHLFKKNNLVITAVPTQHFSGRGPFDTNKTPWNGYVVEFRNLDKKLYFAGDTGYNHVHFNEIGDTFKAMDLSLIPIGVYSPKKFMQTVHISPNEAVHIHREARSKLSVASHHSTFILSKEKKEQPPFDLYCAMEEAHLDHNTFCVLKPGQTINW